MELLETINTFLKKSFMKREQNVPGVGPVYVTMDAAGNETILADAATRYTNTFGVASVDDIVSFAKSLPERYGEEKAKTYRELYVMVDAEDIPRELILSNRKDAVDVEAIHFALNPHVDFLRWMNATAMTQLEFRTLLLELVDQHDCPDLAGMLSLIKYKTEINYEASIETERSFVLAYSENEVQGSFELPKLINVTCPVFSGTKHSQYIQFELVIKRPKNAEEKMKFSLVPHGKSSNMILREAAIHIAEEEFIKCVQAALRIPAEQILPAMYIRYSKLHSYSSNLNFVIVR